LEIEMVPNSVVERFEKLTVLLEILRTSEVDRELIEPMIEELEVLWHQMIYGDPS